MFRSTIAVFFISLFMAMIVTPAVVTMLDMDYDISIMIDSSEEEEKEGKESSKDKDVKILQITKSNFNAFDSDLIFNPGYYSNTYTSHYLKLISPPPEHILTV